MSKGSDQSSGATAAFLARVGEQVRTRRKEMGWTVQQLSESAGLSRRMVTQIELGQANPSLVTVDKLARALGTDFATLTRDGGPEPVAVHPPGQTAAVWTSPAGSYAALQIATRARPAAELWEWVLEPGDRYEAQLDPSGSEELFLALEGVLTLQVEGVAPLEMPAGGCARIASDRSYSYANNGSQRARFVRVVRLGD